MDTSSAQVYESHFLPLEETGPDEVMHLATRLFRSAQEWEQDHYDMRAEQLEWSWTET